MLDTNISDKVALITGSGRRIGAEIARTLHAAGMRIVLHYKTSEQEAMQLTTDLNRSREGSVIAIRADLQDAESTKQFMQKAASHWGRLDALVNNASLFYRTPIGATTEYAWDDLFNINLKVPFFLSQAAYEYLKKTQGCIVNIADIHGVNPLRDYGIYCISKSGLLMMSKVLAKEMGPEIRVNTVSPGAIIWPEGQNTLSDEEKEKIIATAALKREGQPSDIAKAVLYLVRDADYVTGQMIAIDGGRMLSL